MNTSNALPNRAVARTFLSPGLRDILVPCFCRTANWRLESRHSLQAGKPALQRLGSRLRRFIRTDFLAATAVFTIASFLAGCGKHGLQVAPPPPTVSVIQPVQREVVEWDEYIGRLESPATVEIRARVSGYLDKVHFKEGKEVKNGDLLFTIDPRPYQAEYDRAVAEHERAESQADLAKSDADRAKNLIATKAISAEDFDTKTKTYTAALAAVRSAKAAMDSAKLNLDFTQVHAPIDGRISRAVVTEGNLISSGVAGSGATLLTTIVLLNPLYFLGDAAAR